MQVPSVTTPGNPSSGMPSLVSGGLTLRALESSAIASCLVAPDGSFLWVNPALCTLLARPARQLVNCSWQELTHPDDLAADLGLVASVAEGTRNSYRLRKRYLRPDGMTVWGDLTVSAIRDDTGVLLAFLSQIADVTEQVATQARLEASEARFRLLAENAADVVVVVKEGLIDWMSPAVTDTLGSPPEHWVGRPAASFIHPDDVAVYANMLDAVSRGENNLARVRCIAPSGVQHWVEAHARPYSDATGAEVGLIAAFRVVDDLIEAEAELDRRARLDSLTGLANRGEVLEHLVNTTTHTVRTGLRVGVLFCDLDRFKDINDDYGHAAGDDVLRIVAERITESIRDGDVVGRVGGDEILVVLHGVRDLADLEAVAEKIRQRASQRIDSEHGVGITPTLSIGATLLRGDESADDLVARADRAMYLGKRSGRNRVVAIE